jgi:hypothetical protein
MESMESMESMQSMARPHWLLDEVASAGRENLDPGHVARYDTKEDAGAAAEVRLHWTYTWLLEPMIERTGFEIEQATHTSDQIFATYLARAI